jgi:hypothetical protein
MNLLLITNIVVNLYAVCSVSYILHSRTRSTHRRFKQGVSVNGSIPLRSTLVKTGG